MSNPSLTQPKSTAASPRLIQTLPQLDDDDDDAADDDDDDEVIAIPRHDRWFARTGFGSPEWWSR